MRRFAVLALVAAAAIASAATATAGNVATDANGEFLVANGDLFPPLASTPANPRSVALDLHVFYGRLDGQAPRIPDRVFVKLDRGIAIHASVFKTCDQAALTRDGPSACPADSAVGTGTAVFDARPALAAPIHANLKGFIGKATGPGVYRLLFYAQGPGFKTVRTATVAATSTGKYRWTIEFDADPTLPVALTQFDFDYIARTHARRTAGRTVRTALIQAPSRCTGFWYFAVESHFATGDSLTALDRSPCGR